MSNSALTGLLSTFSDKELNDLSEFISLKHINNRKAVSSLFAEIRKYHPEYLITQYMKREIFKNIFPEKKFNENTFKVLNHYLFELTKTFLAVSRFGKDKFQSGYFKLQELILRKQFSPAEKELNKLSEICKSDASLYDYRFLHDYFLEGEKMILLSEMNDGNYEKFLDRIDYVSVYNNLTAFYYIRIFKVYLNMLNAKTIYKSGFDLKIFESMYSTANTGLVSEFPLVELYYYLIKLFCEKDNEKSYFTAKEIFYSIKNSISTEELGEIYINLQNFCNRKVTSGIKKFERERFEIYREQLKDGSYKDNGIMSPVLYKNLVTFALLLNEIEWTEKFIPGYRKELPSDIENNIYKLCLALLEFEKKNFESSLELLSGTIFDNLYLKLDTRGLQIKIYYELGYEESLISSIEAFRHFLLNNQLVPENKSVSFMNFLKFLNKIILLKRRSETLALELLKDKLELQQNITHKDWLLNKLKNS